jgi:hypothetical protein
MQLADNDTLSRDETARALSEAGYPISAAALATMASRGGGPPYHLWNGRTRYRWADALAWAQSRIREPRQRGVSTEQQASAS